MSTIRDEIEQLKKELFTLSKADPDFAKREAVVEELTTFLEKNGLPSLKYKGQDFVFESGDCTIHASPILQFLESRQLFGRSAILFGRGAMSGFELVVKFGPESCEKYKNCESLIPCLPTSEPVTDWAIFSPEYEVLEIRLL